MGNAEVARETGASVMGGGVFVCWDCGGSGARDGVSRELFCLAGVGGGSNSDARSGVFETAMCGGATDYCCRNGVGVCKNLI